VDCGGSDKGKSKSKGKRNGAEDAKKRGEKLAKNYALLGANAVSGVPSKPADRNNPSIDS
jgi:hypothetical protein